MCALAGDRPNKIWKRRPLSIDLWTKEVFIQKMEYTCPTGQVGMIILLRLDYVVTGKTINIHQPGFIKLE
jgi:hypothetical protein